MKVWKTQIYFVYFMFFKLHSQDKRSGSKKRKIVLAKSKDDKFYRGTTLVYSLRYLKTR